VARLTGVVAPVVVALAAAGGLALVVSRAPAPLHHPDTSGDTETTMRVDGAYEVPAEELVA
jgi:hypothetical protein